MSSDLPIVFSGFSVRRGGTAMLSEIDLTICAGPPTVLIGPNGSGKTTLLRAAMGLVKASGGTLSWAGRAASPPLRRALVFQRPVMLRRSVEDNLRYALATAGVRRAARSSRIAELLSLVGLAGFGERPARRLSGGERQRLAIARALARQPEVLLLDEPTASLDPAATQAIEELVRKVSEDGVKVVLATHDLAEAHRLAGDVVLLHRGRVVESGPAERMLAEPATEAARRFVAGQLLL
jgi:tungstate transport system ATP-binding protein